HDSLALNDILNELKVNAEVSDIIRLGKGIDGKIRPLKFTVKEVQVKKEILAEAKVLKNSDNALTCKVFICPDRTQKQREENRKLVAEVKRRREGGESVSIINGAVKPFQPRGSREWGRQPEPTTSGGGSASQ
ncbi:MAG: hypothetical protein AB2693_06225, partial [Candidatus Thiodiazotropha sp.]